MTGHHFADSNRLAADIYNYIFSADNFQLNLHIHVRTIVLIVIFIIIGFFADHNDLIVKEHFYC